MSVIGRNVARPAFRDFRWSMHCWPTTSSSTTTFAIRPPAAVSQACAYSPPTLPSCATVPCTPSIPEFRIVVTDRP
jgi:hypothetical protein